MRPKLLHAFVFLCLHLSQRGDDEVQPDEEEQLRAAAKRVAFAAKLDPGQAKQMVHDAVDRYFELQPDPDRLHRAIEECVEVIEDAAKRRAGILAPLHRELVAVAEAHAGILDEEQAFLDGLAEDWGLTEDAR